MKYEFLGILKPFVPEDVRGKLQDNIKKAIKSCGGEVLKEDIWGKRHLAYKIQGHEEGYYILYGLELPSDKVIELKNEFGMINDLLRYVLIKEDK